MKLRIRLSVAFVLAVMIPMIIMMNVMTSSDVKMIIKTEISSMNSYDKYLTSTLDDTLSSLCAGVRGLSSDQVVRSFANDCRGLDNPENSNYYKYTLTQIETMISKSKDVSEIFILDCDGRVICSSDSTVLGTDYKDAETLYNASTSNNGITRIFSVASKGSPFFYAVRRIYSSSNENTGLVCEKVDLGNIIDTLTLSVTGDYAEMMIIDSEGRFISKKSNTPTLVTLDKRSGVIRDNVSSAIPYFDQEYSAETIKGETGKYAVIATATEVGGWSILGYYDKSSAKASIRKGQVGSRVVSGICILVIIAALITLVFLITEPVLDMLAVSNKANNGNTKTRFDYSSKDEFGQLNKSFNDILDKLYESDQRYQSVISMTDNIIFEVNLKDFKTYVSDNFNQKFSFRAKDDSLKESFLYKIKVHKDDAKKYADDVEKILTTSEQNLNEEYRLKNAYGDFSWIRVRARKFYDRDGIPSKVIGMLDDIDREKKSALKLQQKANFDALTQLYNRSSFVMNLDKEMVKSMERKSLDALMYIDLDDFKHFNDEYGHKCGDEVLKFVADTIKELTFESGFGGRMGGDEFVMCVTNLKFIDDAGSVAAEMISVLNDGFDSESTGLHMNIHCSIGIGFFRENGSTSKELIEAADSAMYKIKKGGKSNYTYVGRG